MLIMPSFQKSLTVEQFQGNYLKPDKTLLLVFSTVHVSRWSAVIGEFCFHKVAIVARMINTVGNRQLF